jgi:8-amino-7-oxononanoate synthase
LQQADFFRTQLKQRGFDVRGDSQIVPLIIGDSQKTVEISKQLQNRGYWVLPIRPPTVAVGQDRLRFSLTYNHDKGIIEKLLSDIYEIFLPG